MSLFSFEGVTVTSKNKRLPGLTTARKLAYLLQVPSYIQEVILSFGELKFYEIKKGDNDSEYYKTKDSVIDWMQNNLVLIDDGNEVNGWNLFTSFKETSTSLVVRRNEELWHFYDELYNVSKKYKKDLLWIPHRNSALLYTYWLSENKPELMKLTLEDFHEILDVNPSHYYSYPQVEQRLKVVTKIMQECGYKFSYEKDDPKYAHSEIIRFEKLNS